MSKDDTNWIKINIKHHNNFAHKYAHSHIEIYNETEQYRLAKALQEIVSILKNNKNTPLALDFGAGTGNLTSHLLNQGCRVVAADISKSCLEHISSQYREKTKMLSTSLLNGVDLTQFPDNHFDLCATYSVLHHVPDYLYAARELCRVTKHGGFIYIDHENSSQSWKPSHEKDMYLEEIGALLKQTFWQRWGPQGLAKRVQLKFLKLKNPRYQTEGDIHIWEDDHIEWELIEKVLLESNFTKIRIIDYLVCREKGFQTPLYDFYKEKYKDMSMLVACKTKKI